MNSAKFLEGSTLRHLINMTLASSIGLMAIFVVDLVDMYFLSLLGELELAAAVGYAGTILFFCTSISIGLSIATTASVAKSIGRKDTTQATRFVNHALLSAVLVTLPVSVIVLLASPWLLNALGASGVAHDLAMRYLIVMLPSLPLLAIAMGCGAILRSNADARRSMNTTLIGAVVNACLDPVFIFALGLDVTGAAIASVLSRVAMVLYGLYSVYRIHGYEFKLHWPHWFEDNKVLFRIALPAVLTNIATPIGNAYVTAMIARYGDSAVAGNAIIGRLMPFAFGAVFALSGAIGPIIAQNFGAMHFERVLSTFYDAIKVVLCYVLAISTVLLLGSHWVISVFNATGQAAELIQLFCCWISFSFFFNGLMFVANACFNNLGYAHYSTLLNFGKATLGTIPFVLIGSHYYGADGVIMGQALGSIVFGILALGWCRFVMRALAVPDVQADLNKPKV